MKDRMMGNMKILTKIFITIDFLIILVLVVVYAPIFNYVQKYLVNDIAIDKKMNYISYTFYNENRCLKSLASQGDKKNAFNHTTRL